MNQVLKDVSMISRSQDYGSSNAHHEINYSYCNTSAAVFNQLSNFLILDGLLVKCLLIPLFPG